MMRVCQAQTTVSISIHKMLLLIFPNILLNCGKLISDQPRPSISNFDQKQGMIDTNLVNETVIDEHIDGDLEFTSLQQRDKRQNRDDRVAQIGIDGYFTVIKQDKRHGATIIPSETDSIEKEIRDLEIGINMQNKRYNVVTILNMSQP